MSYTPTNWQTDDTVTAERLNKMESGIELANDPFVVTLTPTSQDFSGTMDKTVGEIRNAQENGRKILFHMVTGANDYIEVTASEKIGSDWPFPSYCAFVLTDTPVNALISVITPPSNDGSDTNYYTAIYPITPMS